MESVGVALLQSTTWGSGPRILLVEDEVDIAELVRDALEPEGYELAYAPTLTAAAALLHAEHFDVVLCGGLSPLPDAAWRNATTVLGWVGDTPVALLTAHRVDPGAARAAGFRAVIEQPFDALELAERMRALVGGTG